MLGRAHLERGETDRAAAHADRLVAAGTAHDCDLILARGGRLLGRVLTASGDPDGARAHLDEALAGFGRLEMPLEAARTRMLVARVLATGDDPAALDAARRALAAFEGLGPPGTPTPPRRGCATAAWRGDPTEIVLLALTACVGGTLVDGAALGGIDIGGLEVTVDGEFDLRGAFGVDGIRPGLSGVTVTLAVQADVGDATLDELGRESLRLSPTARSLTDPVPVTVAVQRASVPAGRGAGSTS